MALRNHLIHVDQLIELQVILPFSSIPTPLNSIHDLKDFTNNSKEIPKFWKMNSTVKNKTFKDVTNKREKSWVTWFKQCNKMSAKNKKILKIVLMVFDKKLKMKIWRRWTLWEMICLKNLSNLIINLSCNLINMWLQRTPNLSFTEIT